MNVFAVVVDDVGMVVEPVRGVAETVMNGDVVPVVTGFESACAEEVVDACEVSGSRAEDHIMIHRGGKREDNPYPYSIKGKRQNFGRLRLAGQYGHTPGRRDPMRR